MDCLLIILIHSSNSHIEQIGVGMPAIISCDMFTGARVIMACRDMKKCEEACAEIIEATYNKKVFCKKLDLASLESIREFADDIKASMSDVKLNHLVILPFTHKINHLVFITITHSSTKKVL